MSFVEPTVKGVNVKGDVYALPSENELVDSYIDGADGYAATTLFESGNPIAYTYDDIIMMPGHINFGTDEIDLSTNLTRNIRLHVPLVSSPMDTVTEHQMAIAMALQGGIGIIHYNNTIEEQCSQVRLVKRYENGFITNPSCLRPDNTIRDFFEIREKLGFSGFPLTSDGKIGSTLIGIVTSRDVDFRTDVDTKLSEVMTKFEGMCCFSFIISAEISLIVVFFS